MPRCFYHPRQTLITLLLVITLTACQPPTENPPTTIPTEILATTTASPVPTETIIPSPTTTPVPPNLPGIYISDHLNPNDTPHAYIEETCQYLKNRWNPNNAKPGTVVMVVMLANINRGAKPNSADSLTVNQFERMIRNVKEQGFEAINTEQLLAFLEHNQKIPSRSILFLQDGRRTAENFNRHFREQWETERWPVVNAWIIQTDSPDTLHQENLVLEQEGFVDHQLYSSLHRFSNIASEAFLSEELKKYTDIFKERYQKDPIAIIWPGKPGENFTNAARNTGLRLGFTSNTRGPVMYNWIPLATIEDPQRPAYYPESAFNDPLMTLPRYWPSQVVRSLDQVRLVGKHAAAFAEENKEVELKYYDIVCAAEFGPIPDVQ